MTLSHSLNARTVVGCPTKKLIVIKYVLPSTAPINANNFIYLLSFSRSNKLHNTYSRTRDRTMCNSKPVQSSESRKSELFQSVFSMETPGQFGSWCTRVHKHDSEFSPERSRSPYVSLFFSFRLLIRGAMRR